MTELCLHEACAIGDYEALEEYLKTGKYDPNLRDDEWGGKTPLHWACIRGSIECTRLLISIGVDGNVRMDNGWTAAHCAAESGKIHILRSLHAANIRLDGKCYYGDTPLDIAKIYCQRECVKFLEGVYHDYEIAPQRNDIQISPNAPVSKASKNVKKIKPS